MSNPFAPGSANYELAAARLYFPEALRWRDGRLWFSDVFAGTVCYIEDSAVKAVAHVPGMPSGLGWSPDGTLLVVSMEQKCVMSVGSTGELSVYADLGSLLEYPANELIVDRNGRAYVGNYGFDVDGGASPAGTRLVRIDADRSIHFEETDLVFPNGMVLMDQGRSLIVAETFADRLTKFEVSPSGRLQNPTTLVTLPKGYGPDGIATDPSGRVWVACAFGSRVLAVLDDGTIEGELEFPDEGVYCCEVGGSEKRTLFVALAPLDEAEAARNPQGRIVAVPLP